MDDLKEKFMEFSEKLSEIKEEIQEEIEEFSEEVEEFNAEVAEKHEAASDGAEVKEAEFKAELSQKIKDKKGDVIALKQNLQDLADKSESKRNARLLQAQMAIEEGEAELDRAFDELDNLYLESYIADAKDYAEYCMALAEYAAEEAELATLNAKAAQEVLDERRK